MSIWNKVLVGLIIVAALPFFYLAARTVKTHQYWRELAKKHEVAIKSLQVANRQLEEGTPNAQDPSALGIRRMRMELNKLLVDRRRAWFQCDPKAMPAENDGKAAFLVNIAQPATHGIADGTILYVFEEADIRQGGHYLGEFRAEKADEKAKTVVLVSTSRPSQHEAKLLAEAKAPWTMYEVMPLDNHEVFAYLSDDDKKAVLRDLPPECLQTYMNDGQTAAADTPADQIEDGKYIRPIRDYAVAFRAFRTNYTLLTDQVVAATIDLNLIAQALELAKKQEEVTKQDVEAARQDLAQIARERDAVATYSASLQKELDSVKNTVTDLLKVNKAKAGRIAKAQLEAARRIDDRTRAMAQTGAGG